MGSTLHGNTAFAASLFTLRSPASCCPRHMYTQYWRQHERCARDSPPRQSLAASSADDRSGRAAHLQHVRSLIVQLALQAPAIPDAARSLEEVLQWPEVRGVRGLVATVAQALPAFAARHLSGRPTFNLPGRVALEALEAQVWLLDCLHRQGALAAPAASAAGPAHSSAGRAAHPPPHPYLEGLRDALLRANVAPSLESSSPAPDGVSGVMQAMSLLAGVSSLTRDTYVGAVEACAVLWAGPAGLQLWCHRFPAHGWQLPLGTACRLLAAATLPLPADVQAPAPAHAALGGHEAAAPPGVGWDGGAPACPFRRCPAAPARR